MYLQVDCHCDFLWCASISVKKRTEGAAPTPSLVLSSPGTSLFTSRLVCKRGMCSGCYNEGMSIEDDLKKKNHAKGDTELSFYFLYRKYHKIVVI